MLMTLVHPKRRLSTEGSLTPLLRYAYSPNVAYLWTCLNTAESSTPNLKIPRRYKLLFIICFYYNMYIAVKGANVYRHTVGRKSSAAQQSTQLQGVLYMTETLDFWDTVFRKLYLN